MAKPSTQILSVYGQIEKAAADVMIERGSVRVVIPFDQMPAEQQYNDRGDRAHYAIVLDAPHAVREFDSAIALLRA